MTPMHYGDDHYMLRFLLYVPDHGTKDNFQSSSLKLDDTQTQNVRFIKWCNVGLALQNVTVLTYLPSIDFIPLPVYFVGVLSDHCQILIDVV